MNGIIRWYDQRDGVGILKDLKGNEWYFTHWSFPKTHYLVTGKSKKTGRMITVKTVHFPGLFLERKEIHDPICKKLKTGTKVSFQRFKEYDGNWAIKIKMR